MSLTEGKNILVYVETAGDTPVGPALEILAKAKELAGAKGEKLSQLFLQKSRMQRPEQPLKPVRMRQSL